MTFNSILISGILIIFTALIFLFPFFKPGYTEFIRDNFIFCIILSLLTVLSDFAFMTFREITTSKFFFESWNHYFESFLLIFSISGLFLSLRSIPFVGKFFQWSTWIILTIPANLYFLITGSQVISQDVFNLFIIKPEVSLIVFSIFLRPQIKLIIVAVTQNLIVFIIMLFIKIKSKRREYSHKKFQRAAAFLFGILFFISYFINPEGRLNPNDSMGNSITAIWGAVKILKYHDLPREKFIANNPSASEPKSNNIVFILDESIRGDYLSINNPGINTTPKLEKYFNDYPENFFNYGLMLSSATYSYPSRLALLMGLENLKDEDLRSFKNPTIFDIAKANNYKTILINVQSDLPDFAFRKTDMNNVDETYLDYKKLKYKDLKLDTNYDDFDAAIFINKRLKEEKGLFIFLEKRGAHVPYFLRYPVNKPEFNIFKPYIEPSEGLKIEYREKIINSYKNTLRYNIDGFFEKLLGENPKNLKDCTIIYTSDHGQSFMEYGNLKFHGSRHLEQAIVPFLIFSTDSWVLKNLKYPNEIPFTLHHLNINATVHSILCKDLNYSSGEYDSLVTEKNFRRPPLVYITKGHPYAGELSAPVQTGLNGKMILPVEKYIY